MKEQIITILNKHLIDLYLHGLRYGYETNTPLIGKIADEIMKVAEFEELCNPDYGEASMNEAVMMQNYVEREEYNQAVKYIGELQKENEEMRKELSTRDFNDRSNW